MKDFSRLPFKSVFLELKPDPANPPFGENPCLNIDPHNPDFLQLARDCPLRIIPGLEVGRRGSVSTTAPDLVIAAHQSTAPSATEVVHAITVRNTGDGVADIGSPSSGTAAGVQCYVSMNPLLDGESGTDYAAAGGWSFEARQLNPGEEFDLLLPAGTGVPPSGIDFRDFNYVIAQLFVNPSNDQNTGNNLSIVPLLVS